MPDLIAAEEAAASPHAAQLKQGFGRLRFADPLEKEFREYAWQLYRHHSRRGLWIAAILFAAFILRDWRVLPPDVAQITIPFRFFMMLLPMLIAIPVTYRNRLGNSQQWLWGMVFLAVLGQAIVILIPESKGIPMPHEGFLLLLIFAVVFSGVRFVAASCISISVSVIYLLGRGLFVPPAPQLAPIEYYLVVANVIGMIGAYSNQYLLRQVFLIEGVADFRASRDPLTLLPNRRAALEHLERSWRHAIREKTGLSLMLMDVDHFKSYNDRYGHLAGDHVLTTVAKTLESALQRPLDMVARYGGEEFIAVVYGLTPESATQVAENVRAAVERLQVLHAASPAGRLTISIGVCPAVPREGKAPAAALIAQADRALYQAKGAGRNRVELLPL